MSLRRTAVLFWKELSKGSRSFIIILAVVVPVVLSLLLNLVFGDLFAGRATLGIVDQGSSRVPEIARTMGSLSVRQYDSTDELRQAVARGAAEMGMVLPAGFDRQIASGETVEVIGFLWGESGLDSRAVLGTAILSIFREVAGYQPPVEVVTTTLGDAQTLPWEDRMLPLIVLLAMMLGGMMVPAGSLTQERQDRTLSALTITPVTLGEVLTTKALLGVLVASLMAVFTLAINRALGGQAFPLILALVLGSILAAEFGLLIGLLAKDVNSMMGTIKAIGIVLYAPALVLMFPEIPQWVGRLFPTYYIVGPVIEITQRGAGLSEVLPDLAILTLLIAAMIAITAVIARRKAQTAV